MSIDERINKETIGKKIIAIRKNKGMSQIDLAKKANMLYQTLSKYERGLLNPKLETIRKIADALEVNYLEFIEDDSIKIKKGVVKMINRVVLVGRLTRDPELRRTSQGDAVTSFTLAVNRNFTSRDGQQQADFINCVVWRKPAENVERYCSKGSLVGVEGRIQTRSYDNSQGQKVNVVEVICDSVQFLNTKQEDQVQMNTQKVQRMATNEYSRNLEYPDVNTYDIAEDDIQF